MVVVVQGMKGDVVGTPTQATVVASSDVCCRVRIPCLLGKRSLELTRLRRLWCWHTTLGPNHSGFKPCVAADASITGYVEELGLRRSNTR